MKKFTFGLLSLFCAYGTVQSAQAQISKVCSSVINLPDGRFTYKNSAPLRNSSGAMIGLRQEPTLIMKSNGFSSHGGTTIYGANGVTLATCPWAPADGTAGRFRCTMNTGGLRRSALSKGNSATIYIKYKGSACVKVPDAGSCYGSVKGLCNTTLK